MTRTTGTYQTTVGGGEEVRAFIPYPLPPREPPLLVEDDIETLQREAMAAIERLNLAGSMVPSCDWFLYGFVRKEAVLSSQIEGTQATLEDVVSFELGRRSDRPADVAEVCNYIDALALIRAELGKAEGLPLCVRLLCRAHERLMQGVRGAETVPGAVRRSQNWIGGSRPGTARFVPPPPEAVPETLAALEKWLHGDNPLPPLIRAGLAHVQFETIHPFLDGNGRIGRLLIVVLLEHWAVLDAPLLYLSVAFKRRRQEYYDCLNAVRRRGDWEGWTSFFLRCVREAADDAVVAARRLHNVIGGHRKALTEHEDATLTAVRLFENLPDHPMVTLRSATQLLATSSPTAGKAIDLLCRIGILREVTDRQRDRVYAYQSYLDVLAEDTDIPRR
ncbi:MAG: cell filamentation protein Fic [Lentisphaerae bacterium RIFOXYB12_FULL_65_16]|nr:MAG: cell filamentation protein Fic [Lentisphaerae bacterium RIFOXYA12_64_32]OGV87765.1 MAG: cell filamentation protein Fic [Lentisphaerae bacterium RIFOXYB12_FULL_65_16]